MIGLAGVVVVTLDRVPLAFLYSHQLLPNQANSPLLRKISTLIASVGVYSFINVLLSEIALPLLLTSIFLLS